MQNASRASQSDLLRNLRMAGRGGLPRGELPFGSAISIRNNTPASGAEKQIAIGDTNTPTVATGSDVLTVRGVLSSSVYQLGPVVSSFFLDNPTEPSSGWVQLKSPNPDTGIPQNLADLEEVIDSGFPEAIILVSSASDAIYGVVELDPSGSTINGRDNDGYPTDITLAFNIGDPSGSNIGDKYVALSADGDYPSTLQNVAFAGILEEYRYFVRERNAIANDPTSEVIRTLARGRFYPGTEIPHGSDPTLQVDLADNILDLQIALGIDRDDDGAAAEDAVTPGDDEWLFNDSTDKEADAAWNDSGGRTPNLYYVRVSTLARTDRPDPKYVSPAIGAIEDNVYDEPELPSNEAERQDRIYRRRLTQDVVDLRNL